MFRTTIILATVVLSAAIAFAQDGNTLSLQIKNKDTRESIAEAVISVKETDIRSATDKTGTAEVKNIPNGEHVIEVFSPGYEPVELKLTFPLADTAQRIVF